ncbi:hypothetical protein ACETRY_03080 [Cronobacter malonaticus]|uniref:hypothetical protein n=2 Tax=Cronobacter malonaticus TaxID=413503 RepID=UPI00029BF508|nr:hypothetical protein BN130_2234 [Cronobacter malonaticus 507]
MDAIYIVEDISAKVSEGNTPNFTIPGWKNSSATAANVIATTAAITAISVLPGFLFPTLVGIGFLKAFGSVGSNSQDKKQVDSKEFSQKFSEIEEVLKSISLTKSEARRRNYRFPPGHPQPAVTYKLHPLALFGLKDKKDLYIPEESYASVLLEEREAELLRLLVDLGAKRIEVRKKEQHKHTGALTVKGDAEALALSSGEAEFKQSSISEDAKDNLRLFELKGKPWKYGDKIEQGIYSWLAYEASWQSLILARETGGCMKATIEVKENAVYSSELEFQLGIKYKLLSAEAGINYDKRLDKALSYIVTVDFNEPS